MYRLIPVLFAIAGCSALFPPAPEPAPVAAVDTVAPIDSAWAAAPDLALSDSVGPVPIPFLFTPLVVVGRDSATVRVRCDVCRPDAAPPEGVLPLDAVVMEPLPPEVAAWGSLAEFVLAVRSAAAARDLEALRPVMAEDFSFSFVGIQSPAAAFDVWRSEDFATLDLLPALLDRGLVTGDERIWSAPPAFLAHNAYRGVRTGFRKRPDGRWEWLYLIQGVIPEP